MYKDCYRKEKAIKDLDGRIAGGLFIGIPIFGQWSSWDMGAKLRNGPVLSLFCKMDSRVAERACDLYFKWERNLH